MDHFILSMYIVSIFIYLSDGPVLMNHES